MRISPLRNLKNFHEERQCFSWDLRLRTSLLSILFDVQTQSSAVKLGIQHPSPSLVFISPPIPTCLFSHHATRDVRLVVATGEVFTGASSLSLSPRTPNRFVSGWTRGNGMKWNEWCMLLPEVSARITTNSLKDSCQLVRSSTFRAAKMVEPKVSTTCEQSTHRSTANTE